MSKNTNPKADFNFEKSMEELEAIVTEMEADRLPLEDLIVYYEKGTTLLKNCEATLNEAKKRLQTIANDATSSFNPPSVTQPSAPSSADDDIRLF